MVDDGRDTRIVQRGIDEAMACRDMLTSGPVRANRVGRMLASIVAVLRAVGAAFSQVRVHRRPTPGTITKPIR